MTDLTISENDLQTYNEAMESLEHHGILGQKWGRQQGPPYPLDSEDHSAAEKKAGWRKSLEGATEKIKAATEKAKAEIAARKESPKPAQNTDKKEEEKKPLDKKAVINSADAKTIQENASQLTTQELQEAVNRMNLMQQVNSRVPTPPTIQDKIDGAIGKLDKAATTVTNGINAYNKIAKIYNKFQDPPLPVLDSSAAERAEKKARDAKEAREKEKADLKEKLIRSGDLEKIKKNSDLFSTKELEDALNRDSKMKDLEKRINKNKETDESKSKNNSEQKPDNKSKENKPKEGKEGNSEQKEKKNTSNNEMPSEPAMSDKIHKWAENIRSSEDGEARYRESMDQVNRDAFQKRVSKAAEDKAWDDLNKAFREKNAPEQDTHAEPKQNNNSEQKTERYSGDVVGTGSSFRNNNNSSNTSRTYTDDDAVDVTYREVVSQFPALREASTSSFTNSQRSSLVNKLEDKGLPTYWLLEDKSAG